MKGKNMSFEKFSFIIGFTIWLLATIVFRFGGNFFFLTGNIVVMWILYLILIPSLGFTAFSVFNRYQLGRLDSVKSSVIMVVPGLFLDSICLKFFRNIFPNMALEDVPTFGSWLMFAYSIVLICGLLRKDRS